MITNIWLKSQPNKKISYPNCYPLFSEIDLAHKNQTVEITKNDLYYHIVESKYSIESVSRVEFRP